MLIDNLKLHNFRNLKNVEITLHKKLTILYGDNAQGKTNVLESIYFLALGKSNKKVPNFELIKEGELFLRIEAKTFNKDLLTIVITQKKRKIEFNNSEIKRLKDLVGNIIVVWFSPEDLNIIKGSPSIRRTFLDSTISQMSKEYLSLLYDYKKISIQRKLYLKSVELFDQLDTKYLDIISSKLVTLNNKILKIRYKFIEDINKTIVETHYKFTEKKEKLNIIYLPNKKEYSLNLLKNQYRRDFYNKGNSVGIHLDDLAFEINDHTTKNYISQGQVRNIILSLKITVVDIIKTQLGKEPILLLDDVLSELDLKRQNNLMNIVGNKTQTVITTNSLHLIDDKYLKDSKIYRINQGEIKESDYFE